MTREEAIKELSYIADEMPSMECADWIEAISMAIEALEQEPCNDAISRQQAIDAIFAEPLYKPGMKKRYAEEAVPAIFEKIKLLPPVKPAEKVGQWVGIDEEPHESFECNNCGNIMCAVYDINDYNYCPNCGAKMAIQTETESEDKK